MTDLMVRTPFGELECREAVVGSLIITEAEPKKLVSISGSDLTLERPKAGELLKTSDYSAFSTGVNQWFVELTADGELTTEGYYTDQTDGWAVADVAGPAAVIDKLLTKLINLDVRSLQKGAAVRTLMGHLSVYVLRRHDGLLSVMVGRSMAEALWHDLMVAAKRLT